MSPFRLSLPCYFSCVWLSPNSCLQIADCPDDQVQITVYKKGIAFGVGRPEDWWHVETVGDTICYETTYIDANFLTQNYTLGECPDQFTVDLSSTDEVICNGRSSENVRAHSAPCKRQVARHIKLPSFGRC